MFKKKNMQIGKVLALKVPLKVAHPDTANFHPISDSAGFLDCCRLYSVLQSAAETTTVRNSAFGK